MAPLPERIGPLRTASLYLAAEDEAQIGGDLYAAARADSTVRVLIGDVRGKGLPAVGEAALLLGAFREGVHRHTSLPDLAATLEQSVTRYAADSEPPEEAGERFATALLAEIPDGAPVVRMTSCGHPPPLLLRPGHSVSVADLHPSPPLGVHGTLSADHTLDVVAFEPGDTVLLYTDGVAEARDTEGRFYPLAERVAQWSGASPEALMHHIRRDLLAYCGGRLDDDAALVALHRAPTAHRRSHGRRIRDGDRQVVADELDGVTQERQRTGGPGYEGRRHEHHEGPAPFTNDQNALTLPIHSATPIQPLLWPAPRDLRRPGGGSVRQGG
ncbi:serine phosphatase RsbU (regulator of sigma subunit) [Streptomyces sp. V3I7]|nr:serine phosphatase RsbU (regulator of sigma subunit) [Streptomyces sp. V3I7]